MWEEVWDLPQTAYLSGWLLIIITVGAMVCSWFFERRLWCRHLCPIGGMNGMFAKLSMTELRAQPGVCSGVLFSHSSSRCKRDIVAVRCVSVANGLMAALRALKPFGLLFGLRF